MDINCDEREYLRDLAKRQLEISKLPIMEQRKKKWYKLNNGELYEPVVTIQYNSSENSGHGDNIYPPVLCSDPLKAGIEKQMNRNLTWHTLFNDDRVIPDYLFVEIPNSINAFGYKADRTKTFYADGQQSIGFKMNHLLSDLEQDFHLLKKSPYTVDNGLKKANEMKSKIEEIVGDILPVKIQFPSHASFGPGNTMVSIMGMEKMMISLYDYPEKFHQAIQMLLDDHMEFMDAIEEGGAILPNGDGSYLNQGSWGYTDHLPTADQISGKVTFKDVWGYSNSQETVNISPEMFDEFFFTYIEQTAKRFGLYAYGCCEPVDVFWDKSLSRLKNLRKISISPWCNEEFIGERLRGKGIVYHRKPSPNYISVDSVFNEDALRKHITKTITASKGCPLEITFRDVITARGEPWRFTRAIEIVKEQYESCWQP